MTDIAPSQLDLALQEVVSGKSLRSVSSERKIPRSTLTHALEKAKPTDVTSDLPVPPPGARLPSPLEDVFRRLNLLESSVEVRKVLEGISPSLFDDLEADHDDEVKGRNSGSPTEG